MRKVLNNLLFAYSSKNLFNIFVQASFWKIILYDEKPVQNPPEQDVKKAPRKPANKSQAQK
jgi:hypothetical protein